MKNNQFINVLRKLLFPFSLIYGLIVFFRNKLYDWEIFQSHSFQSPVVCVGNITVGGTGKTPHTEWLLREFSTRYKLGILSRGYGRKTKGFRLLEPTDDASLVGDEPLQMKQKFPNLTFAVDEDRKRGINKLLASSNCDIVVLDDAFQHRSVKPSFNIVLMDYNRLPHEDTYLPSGNLRDGLYSLSRADCILVTKCPTLGSMEKQAILNRYEKYNKPIYFTQFHYNSIVSFSQEKELSNLNNFDILVVTAIANPIPLYEYIKDSTPYGISYLEYSDHHHFTMADSKKIARKWQRLSGKQKIILTTEKDKVKLVPLFQEYGMAELIEKSYYITIKVQFAEGESTFYSQIQNSIGSIPQSV